jgi:hypothetical protein
VASGAFALLYGGVHELFRSEIFMAVGAELAHVGYRFEFMLPLENVAESAVARGNRPVDKLVFSHLAVAITGHARRFLLPGTIVHCSGIPRCIHDKKNGSCNRNYRQKRNVMLFLSVHKQETSMFLVRVAYLPEYRNPFLIFNAILSRLLRKAQQGLGQLVFV